MLFLLPECDGEIDVKHFEGVRSDFFEAEDLDSVGQNFLNATQQRTSVTMCEIRLGNKSDDLKSQNTLMSTDFVKYVL
jgi:hypothetical protein